MVPKTMYKSCETISLSDAIKKFTKNNADFMPYIKTALLAYTFHGVICITRLKACSSDADVQMC
jgi:hypothetical protein